MKRYTLLWLPIILLFIHYEMKAEKINDLIGEMKSQAGSYLHRESEDIVLSTFEKMNELDFDLKKEKCLQLLDGIDPELSSANQLRDMAFILYASDFKEQAKTLFYAGAMKGDPYCINYVLVDLTIEAQDPQVALEFLELLPGNPGLPMLYNLALLFYHIKDREINELGEAMAELFFQLIDQGGFTLSNHNKFEFLEYEEDPLRRLTNGAWHTAYESSDVLKNLSQLYSRQ